VPEIIIIKNPTTDGYSIVSDWERCNRQRYLDLISRIGSNWFIAVTSQVRRRWFRANEHVMVLDCDSSEAMLGTCHYLATHNINYALIQSSPSRYWVVCDRVAPFSEVIRMTYRIPGVDQNYLQMASATRFFSIRAVPWKPLTITNKRDVSLPIFSKPDSLQNPLVRSWYCDFEQLWLEPEVQERYRSEMIMARINSGQILCDAQDPEFVL